MRRIALPLFSLFSTSCYLLGVHGDRAPPHVGFKTTLSTHASTPLGSNTPRAGLLTR
jgi:hypothetical protein